MSTITLIIISIIVAVLSIIGWTCLFREKPFLLKLPGLICPIWVYETKLNTGESWRNIGERIDSNAFPEVTFENSPMEVELVIKK